MFEEADDLLFNQANSEAALPLYHRILEQEPQNTQALNSVASCLKHKATLRGLSVQDLPTISAAYQRVLAVDSTDIEANFNLGLLYLQLQ